LLGTYRFPGQQRINRSTQFVAGYRIGRSWAAVVQAATISEALILIKQKEVGGALRAIAARHFLRRVVAVRKGEMQFRRLLAQA